MDDDTDSGPQVDVSEIFLLAACQPLRGQPGCHVAPQLPAEVVIRALNTYLRPRPDELLLAIIEQPGPIGPEPGCTLTTRRICWPSGPERDARPPGASRSGKSLDYDALPEAVAVNGSPMPRLILGRGQELPLRESDDSGSAAALAGVLSTISHARRTGDLAGSTTRAALNRARAEIGHVVQQAQALHRSGGEVRSFQADVHAATPRVVVSYVVFAACVLVFAAMVLSGVSILNPSVPELAAWGGNVGTLVAIEGESWRLLTSMFLHGGLIHLAVNMWVLSRVGPLIERLYGNAGFALLYLGAGLGGSIASAWWHPMSVSVGASGAIFGLIGGLGAFLVSHRSAIPAAVVAQVRGGVIAFVVYNTLFGLAIPGIDNAAHLGGLGSGFVAGLLLGRPWPVPRPTAGLLRQLVGGLAMASVLTLLGGVMAREVRRNPEVVALLQDIQQPVRSYNTFMGALAPLLIRSDAINQEFDALLERLDRLPADAPKVRLDLAALIDQAEANRKALESIDPSDADLAALRDAIVGAEDDLIQAMRAFDRFLDDPRDVSRLTGPEGVNHYRQLRDDRIEAFNERHRAYLKTHGLVFPSTGAEDDSPDGTER